MPSPGDIPEPGSPPEYLTPQTVLTLPPAASVQAGGSQTCALTRSGQVYCWGELRDQKRNTEVPIASPQLVAGLPPSEQFVLDRTSCALSRGESFCWGYWCPFTDWVDRPTKIEWVVPSP